MIYAVLILLIRAFSLVFTLLTSKTEKLSHKGRGVGSRPPQKPRSYTSDLYDCTNSRGYFSLGFFLIKLESDVITQVHRFSSYIGPLEFFSALRRDNMT